MSDMCDNHVTSVRNVQTDVFSLPCFACGPPTLGSAHPYPDLGKLQLVTGSPGLCLCCKAKGKTPGSLTCSLLADSAVPLFLFASKRSSLKLACASQHQSLWSQTGGGVSITGSRQPQSNAPFMCRCALICRIFSPRQAL